MHTGPLTGRGALLVALFALAAGACGGTPFPASARTTNVHPVVPAPVPSTTTPTSARATTPRTARATPATKARPTSPPSTTIPPAAAPPAPAPQLALIGDLPTMDVLGDQWVDQGDPGSSLDLTDPPAPCLAYMPVITTATATVLHEYSFLPSADGNYEQGHINVAAVHTASSAKVAAEIVAAAQPAFGACAQASAARRFQEVDTGTIDSVTAKIISLPVSGAHVIWRATVAYRTSDGSPETSYMDVAYLGAGAVLVKIRIASCGCNAPDSVTGELLPGEIGALQEIARRLGPTMISG